MSSSCSVSAQFLCYFLMDQINYVHAKLCHCQGTIAPTILKNVLHWTLKVVVLLDFLYMDMLLVVNMNFAHVPGENFHY